MKFRHIVLFVSIFFVTGSACAQQTQKADTLIHKLDSLQKKTDSTGYQVNNTKEAAYNDVTKLSFRDYFILLGSNLKQGFTKPFHMTGKDWKKFGIFSAVTIATGFADEPIQKQALKLRTQSTSVRNTSNYVSKFGGLYEVYTLAAFGTYGLVFKNQKVKTTTLLATQAYITGGIIEAVLKTLSGRTRPSAYGPYQEAEPTFEGPFGKTSKDAGGKRTNSSFPSGHTTVAFAAATVFAKEYASQPLVPIIAYSAATLIGLSRITENKHWTTDVLVGAALGYLTGRQVVNNYHRFAKIKTQAAKKAQLSFNLEYNFGRMMPGIVYKF
jgi:membrane-associated phospholipid phosphatase